LAGQEVSSEALLDAYERAALSDGTLFKGMVLDGLPCVERTESGKDSNVRDIAILNSIMKNKPANFRPVMINLDINDDDLIKRRRDQWIDPMTGFVYPGAQVEYSKRRRTEGWVDGEPDLECLAAIEEDDEVWNGEGNVGARSNNGVNQDNEESDEKDPEEDRAEEDDAGSESENSDASKKKKNKRPEDVYLAKLASKSVWPILPKEVTERFVQTRLIHHLKILTEKNKADETA
jgi:hypothetical protein